MANSGIYIVTLKSEEFMPSQLGDDESLMVNKHNVKYGKSKNLKKRQQYYEEHFGEKNVNFKVVFLSEDPDADEAIIAEHLTAWRCKSPKNQRPLEWLHTIKPHEVEKIITNNLQAKQASDNDKTIHPVQKSKFAVTVLEIFKDKGLFNKKSHWELTVQYKNLVIEKVRHDTSRFSPNVGDQIYIVWAVPKKNPNRAWYYSNSAINQQF